MEYCDAGTLEEIGHLGLPMAHIQDYTAQLLAATYVLHENGIIHRDIKGKLMFLLSDDNDSPCFLKSQSQLSIT